MPEMRSRAAAKRAAPRRATRARGRGRAPVAAPGSASALVPLLRTLLCLAFVFAVGSGLWSPLAGLGVSPVGQGALAAAAAIVVGSDGAALRSWLRRPVA